MNIDKLFPRSEQTILERYIDLRSLGVVFYDQSTFDTDGSMYDFSLSESELKALDKNPLVKVVKSLTKKFDNTNFCYMPLEKPCYFSGGGVEKIIGRVPYDERNFFYKDISNLINFLHIPLINKREENKIKENISGYIHFLYLHAVKLKDVEEVVVRVVENARFLIFALPSKNYLQQEHIQKLIAEQSSKV